jgi:hypothetical protein
MIKFFISLIVYLSIARWIYDETALVNPDLADKLDAFTEQFSLPTHDHWEAIADELGIHPARCYSLDRSGIQGYCRDKAQQE